MDAIMSMEACAQLWEQGYSYREVISYQLAQPSGAGQKGEGTPAPTMSARDAALCRATAKDLEDGDPEGAKMRLEKYFKCVCSKGPLLRSGIPHSKVPTCCLLP